MDKLKAQLEKTRVKLTKAQNIMQVLQGEKSALQSEVKALKKQLAARQNNGETKEKQRVRFALDNSEETKDCRGSCLLELNLQKEENQKLLVALKEAEQQLRVQQLQWEEDNASLTKKMETSEASHLAQLGKKDNKIKKFEAHLLKLKEQWKSDHGKWQQEKTSLQEEMDKSRALLVAQLQENERANVNLVASLKITEQQSSFIKDFQLRMDALQGEREALHDEVEAFKIGLSALKQLSAEAEASYLLKINQQKDKNQKLLVALEEAEQQLKQLQWQEEKSSLITQMETSGGSCFAQLEITENEKKKFEADLQELQEQQENNDLIRQQEKTSLLEEMDKSIEEQQDINNDPVTPLKSLEQQMERCCTERQEDVSSLVQAIEDLRNTFESKKQEWDKTWSFLTSLVDDLERKMSQIKKRKKKWYGRLFS
ncbi:kinesin-like protein KIN-14P [Mugil cephalus]|uniref:kinesin-like protein KIN-14P n=1 Tax=Mugil cephalus TaxID=48193 RepID=UPI001FB7DE2D|nr:kinesin-like protein KIN-14P [Mugil cephalus]